MEMKQFLLETINEAGMLALDWAHRREQNEVHYKSAKDLVTDADFAVEALIKDRLQEKFPNFGFWGEESGQQKGQDGRWIVDPIDGTVSFARGFDYWSVSIAVEIEGKIEMGAVFAPALELLFYAEKGKGATRNGKAIQVSKTDRLEQVITATGFACIRSDVEPNNLPRFNRIVKEVLGFRIRGSAAVDLCSVADGSLDAFFEQNLNLYDVAAGALILEEAGGKITDFKGKEQLDPKAVMATNGSIHHDLLNLA
ncbi:MAG: inositol monophosphatase [SAR324 cluster bacterium]|nr:inositol monophosphatase [SAR324 cluster bacterium]